MVPLGRRVSWSLPFADGPMRNLSILFLHSSGGVSFQRYGFAGNPEKRFGGMRWIEVGDLEFEEGVQSRVAEIW